MAFEDLLRVQAYVRGDGRNYMAEAIRQRGKRKEDLQDREQRREDVFESQRRSHEAYLDRLKAMQNFKLQSDFPKKEGETDDQWQERVGKDQAATINEYYQKSADARAGMETAIQEEQRRREPQARALALNALRENSDSKTKKLLEGATDITGVVEGLQKKNPKVAQQLRQQYDAILDQVRDGLLFDEKGTAIDPKLRIKLRNLESEATEWNKGARDLIDTFRSDGTFRGAPYLKLPERKTAPQSTPPEGFAPRKSPGRSSGGRPLPSTGGLPSAGTTPATGPGASSSPPLRLPGTGSVPNWLNANVIEPVAQYLPLGAEAVGRSLAEPVRATQVGVGNLGRSWFSGNPAQTNQFAGATDELSALINPMSVPDSRGFVPPMADAELGGALRASPVRSAPLAANVTANELQEFMANELGMDFSQIDQHFQEKAQGNPEAAEAEQEILSQIMRRRAMPPPMEPVLMR